MVLKMYAISARANRKWQPSLKKLNIIVAVWYGPSFPTSSENMKSRFTRKTFTLKKSQLAYIWHLLKAFSISTIVLNKIFCRKMIFFLVLVLKNMILFGQLNWNFIVFFKFTLQMKTNFLKCFIIAVKKLALAIL